MKWLLISLIIVLIVVSGIQSDVAGSATFPTLFDDFEGRRIDPTRWTGTLISTDAGDAIPYEIAVEQAKGRLKIELQTYGVSNQESGQLTRLFITSPVTKRAVQVTARLEDIDVKACDVAIGEIFARFFRIGYIPDPADLTNAIAARVSLQASADLPPNTVRVRHSIQWCQNYDCSTSTILGAGFFNDTSHGMDVVIAVEWDRVGKNIVFTKNDETFAFSYASNGWIETTQDTNVNKGVRVRAIHGGCAPSSAWARWTFDNFRVKP